MVGNLYIDTLSMSIIFLVYKKLLEVQYRSHLPFRGMVLEHERSRLIIYTTENPLRICMMEWICSYHHWNSKKPHRCQRIP